MEQDNKIVRVVVDVDGLPMNWPTHRHPSEFWEQLGRTIATFGFLEEILAKAVFAYTGTRRYPPDEVQTAYPTWIAKMERIFSDTLTPLADTFAKAAHEHPDNTLEDIEELKEKIKAAAEMRNVLCHGSWRAPDGDGFSLPFFQNRRGEFFASMINIAYLKQVQQHVKELTCSVINSVTHMGFAFPGSDGPGRKIWPTDT